MLYSSLVRPQPGEYPGEKHPVTRQPQTADFDPRV